MEGIFEGFEAAFSPVDFLDSFLGALLNLFQNTLGALDAVGDLNQFQAGLLAVTGVPGRSAPDLSQNASCEFRLIHRFQYTPLALARARAYSGMFI